jgi:demethylmenaquinone methyltransferase/2-methoxy-6-polyprenyl-1,4-benzoquinol methylase
VFRWGAPFFDRLARHWGPHEAEALASWLSPTVPPGGRLLDLGGGTGALARLLAERLACTVTVLDASREMLAYAHGLPGVHVVGGDAAAMPFPDESFDAVLVCDAFHHFTNQACAAREIERVVRPGGGVVVVEVDPERRGMRTLRWIERLAGEPAAFLTPTQLTALMRRAGVEGRSVAQGRASYLFSGRVAGGT